MKIKSQKQSESNRLPRSTNNSSDKNNSGRGSSKAINTYRMNVEKCICGLNDGLLCGSSKKHSSIATSSTEAEYIGLSYACKEVICVVINTFSNMTFVGNGIRIWYKNY